MLRAFDYYKYEVFASDGYCLFVYSCVLLLVLRLCKAGKFAVQKQRDGGGRKKCRNS